MSKTADDFSKYSDVNLATKLKPTSKCIEDMQARLEEFQTMMSFLLQDRNDSVKILSALLEHKDEFDDLCKKIDTIETLISHIKNNLDKAESDIEKAEIEMGCVESSKVASIFSPFFKKSHEKRNTSQECMEVFRTEDYFQCNESDET